MQQDAYDLDTGSTDCVDLREEIPASLTYASPLIQTI